jgi:glycosyltransferase involved in cell wall biosynthesis
MSAPENQRPVRVCHILSSLLVGGAEMQLVNYLRVADRERFIHQVVCIGRDGPLRAHLEPLLVPLVILGKQPQKLDLIKASWKLRQALRDFRPDVVHMQAFNAAWRGRLVALTLRPRPALLYTEHGLKERTPSRFKRRAMIAVDRALAPWTDRLISVSQATLDLRLAREKYPRSRTSVIYNGIDVERFASLTGAPVREELGIPAGRLVITAISRLEPHKNQATLITALERLAGRLDFHCLIVGDGSAAPALKAQAAQSAIAERITLTGYRPDVPDILAATDIYCLPSRSEDFPVAVLEAMAAGCAVVATPVGGVPEVVVERQTGLLVQPDDADGMAQALLTLGEDPDLRERLAQNGRQQVEAGFSVCHQADELERLYRQTAEARRPSHRTGN